MKSELRLDWPNWDSGLCVDHCLGKLWHETARSPTAKVTTIRAGRTGRKFDRQFGEILSGESPIESRDRLLLRFDKNVPRTDFGNGQELRFIEVAHLSLVRSRLGLDQGDTDLIEYRLLTSNRLQTHFREAVGFESQIELDLPPLVIDSVMTARFSATVASSAVTS